jgi:diketogulonate reductase-like aldo/keto reductase
MGVIKSALSCCGILVVLLAVAVGGLLQWLRTKDQPEAVMFATMIPLMGGIRPGTIFHGSDYAQDPKGCGVPEVLSAAKAKETSWMQPRPAKEGFVKMPGGGKMPASGLGTCCRPNVYEYESVYRQIMHFFAAGGRHIDTAALYLNHAPIGKAISDAVKDYGLTREEIFITTKINNWHFGRETVKEVVRGFVNTPYVAEKDHYDPVKDKALGLGSKELKGYIDLVLIHFPVGLPAMVTGGAIPGLTEECKQKNMTTRQCRVDTWMGLTDLRKEGIIKEAGVSNFEIFHLDDVMGLDAAPIAANQIEYNPFSKQKKHELFDFCKNNSIAVMPYFSVGSFFNKEKLMSDPDLLGMKKIMESKGKSIALLLQRWAVQKGAAVIPGSGNPKHMAENLGVYDFTLTAEEMATIDQLGEHPLAATMQAGTMEFPPEL